VGSTKLCYNYPFVCNVSQLFCIAAKGGAENAGHEIVTYFSCRLYCYPVGYITDRMFNSLLSMNCFDELFVAFDFNVVKH